MRFPTMWYARPTKPQISLIRAYASRLNSIKLLTEHYLEVLSLKGCCTGSAESTLVKIPDCWKSNVAAHFIIRGQGNRYSPPGRTSAMDARSLEVPFLQLLLSL